MKSKEVNKTHTPAELETVDRLINLANACATRSSTQLKIKTNAIVKAARMLGVDDGVEEAGNEQD